MRFFIILLWSILLAVPAFAAQTLEGKVIKISDGDTVTVLTDKREQVKVRLYGVDCPESRQAFGTRARQYTSGHVFGKRVRVEIMDTDRYGRTVGIVSTRGGKVLNRELLASGMAWLYTAYCKAPFCREWKKAENAARRSRLGLWADKKPVPPWEYRKNHRRGKGKTAPAVSFQ